MKFSFRKESETPETPETPEPPIRINRTKVIDAMRRAAESAMEDEIARQAQRHFSGTVHIDATVTMGEPIEIGTLFLDGREVIFY